MFDGLRILIYCLHGWTAGTSSSVYSIHNEGANKETRSFKLLAGERNLLSLKAHWIREGSD